MSVDNIRADYERREARREEIAAKVKYLKTLPKPPKLVRGGDSVFLSSSSAYPAFVREKRVQRQENDLTEKNSRFLMKEIVAATSSASSSSGNNQQQQLALGGGAAMKHMIREKQKQWLVHVSVARFLHIPLQAAKILAMIKLRKLFAPVIRRARVRIRRKRKMAWLLIASSQSGGKMTKPTAASLKEQSVFFKHWPEEILSDLLEQHLVPASDACGSTLVMAGCTVCDVFISDSCSDLGIYSARQRTSWSSVEMTLTRRVKPEDKPGVVLLGDLSVVSQAHPERFKFSLELRVGSGLATSMFWRIPHADVLRYFTEQLTRQQQFEASRATRCSYLELTAPLDSSRVLASLNCFEATWPLEFVKKISSKLEPRFYPAGTRLFKSGEKPHQFILTVSGCVQMTTYQYNLPPPHSSSSSSSSSSPSTVHFSPRRPSTTTGTTFSQNHNSNSNNTHSSSGMRNSLVIANSRLLHDTKLAISKTTATTTTSPTRRRSSSSSAAAVAVARSPRSPTTATSSYQSNNNNNHRSNNNHYPKSFSSSSSSSSSPSILVTSEWTGAGPHSFQEQLGPWTCLDNESTLVCGVSKRNRTAVCATDIEAWVCDFSLVQKILYVEFPSFALTVRGAFLRNETALMQKMHQQQLTVLQHQFQQHAHTLITQKSAVTASGNNNNNSLTSARRRSSAAPATAGGGGGNNNNHHNNNKRHSSVSSLTSGSSNSSSNFSSSLNHNNNSATTFSAFTSSGVGGGLSNVLLGQLPAPAHPRVANIDLSELNQYQHQVHHQYLLSQLSNRSTNICELVRTFGGGGGSHHHNNNNNNNIPLFRTCSDETLAGCLEDAVPFVVLPGDSFSHAFLDSTQQRASKKASFIVVLRGSVVIATLRESERNSIVTGSAFNQQQQSSSSSYSPAELNDASSSSNHSVKLSKYNLDEQEEEYKKAKARLQANAAARSLQNDKKGKLASVRDEIDELRDPGIFLPHMLDAPLVLGSQAAFTKNASVATTFSTSARTLVTAAGHSIAYGFIIQMESLRNALSNAEMNHASELCNRLTALRGNRLGGLAL